jgi:hypothetical protein
MKAASAACLIASLFMTASVRAAGDHLDVKVSAAMREYCHIVQFPQGWTSPIWDERGTYLGREIRDYEFRVRGLLGTRFLVAGRLDFGTERTQDGRLYTANKYEVDLSDPKAPVRPTSNETWISGTIMSLTRKRPFVVPGGREKPIELHGFLFTKSGQRWARRDSLLSPDRRWLVLQSWTGPAAAPCGSFNICFEWRLFFGYKGKIFFDIFNADNGKKLLTTYGRYDTPDPDAVFGRTAWMTERYFIVPMGRHLERCLVCEFGRSQR